MSRCIVLGTVLMLGGLSVAVAARQQAGTQPGQAPRVVQVDKVRDNLFVMKGGGGNSSVFVTAEGVVVVDTKNPGWGQPLLDGIKSVTNKPVIMIINTHTHGDHVSGNVEFPANVEVVTHENTKKNMEAMRPASFVAPAAGGPAPNIFKQNNGRGMPTRTYATAMRIGSGTDRIDLRYFGRAHTDGDTFVVFPALGVMHAADVFPNKGVPGMDSNNGGSGVDFSSTVLKAAEFAAANKITTVINGHNDATTTVADLRQYSQFVREYVAYAQRAKRAGKSVDQAVGDWKVPARYKGYSTTPNAVRDKANFALIYQQTK